MKTEQEQIDEMVKVIKGFDICGLFGRCFSTGADGENTRYITCPECFAEALYNAGYGDVSEYKAEIERLKDEIIYLERKVAIRDNALKDRDRAIEMLDGKQDTIVNQAKIDVLNKTKKCSYCNNDFKDGKWHRYVFVDDIDKLIEEVQNGEDKS